MRSLKVLLVLAIVVVAIGAGATVGLRASRGKVGAPTEVKPGFFTVTNAIGIELYAARENVCTITGYEEREVTEVVTPAVTQTVVKPMPVWECAPVLAPRPPAADGAR